MDFGRMAMAHDITKNIPSSVSGQSLLMNKLHNEHITHRFDINQT